ncbi:hypothetical protein BDZ85DRAFT_127587 [Elsinoe ampelina]|uniref:Uncharacterized protein n=1 Tax=Elsinoe ampelina TaxID=302913 RepID=A0A6A6G9Y9_9PEZI|nr:hypothetical protein BDZ85DRAFT_127587 [Elsinoe ampelina]
MKGLSTIAFFSTIVLATAQFHFNEKDSTFSCTQTSGLAAYCAGGDIIIRCSNGVGSAGNCNDNLAGEYPYGNNGLAGCYQTAPSTGDAACTKAGLVYPATGAGDSRNTDPYPIPGANKVVAPQPVGTGVPLSTGTGSPNANNDQSPAYWSNSTTVTIKPVPAFTAGATIPVTTAPGAASTSMSTSRPQVYTGAAIPQTQPSTKPYWAFAIFAVVALL